MSKVDARFSEQLENHKHELDAHRGPNVPEPPTRAQMHDALDGLHQVLRSFLANTMIPLGSVSAKIDGLTETENWLRQRLIIEPLVPLGYLVQERASL